MTMRSRKFVRDNGDEVEVDFSYRHVSHNEIEITEQEAWLWIHRDDASAPTLELTDAENNRFLEEVYADPSTWEYDDD